MYTSLGIFITDNIYITQPGQASIGEL